jgi:hypothetical protein
MTTEKKPVTLPGEEGEWEPFEFTFSGEPGDSAMLEVRNWPGSENVRVFQRVAEKVMPEVRLYDSVCVDGLDNQGYWVHSIEAVVISVEPLYCTIIDRKGAQHCVRIDGIFNIQRDGEQIYP